jgi:hypothetical protein
MYTISISMRFLFTLAVVLGLSVLFQSVSLASSPATVYDGWHPALSPSGEKVVYGRHADDLNLNQVVIMNEDGTQQVVVAEYPGFVGEFEYSPDGANIAYVLHNNNVGGELWVMKPDGSGQRRLAMNSWSNLEFAWSPDGTQIAYHGVRGDWSFDIFLVDLHGNVQNLTNNVSDQFAPVWSPDGTQIAYQWINADNLRAIYYQKAQPRAAATQATSYHERLALWEWGLHTVGRNIYSGHHHVADGVAPTYHNGVLYFALDGEIYSSGAGQITHNELSESMPQLAGQTMVTETGGDWPRFSIYRYR